MTRTVVVGASVAGVRTAQALRREDYAGEIVVIGAESEVPYDKPPLSKAVLAGSSTLDGVRLITPESARQLAIELRLGVAAARVDLSAAVVVLEDGSSIGFDHLVLATGTRARPSPWGVPRGLHLLRTASDCLALQDDLRAAGSLVVIGAGFIGSEVAATAAYHGVGVTMVDPLPVPMSRIVGDTVGELLASVHGQHGVATRFGVGVVRVEERAGQLVTELGDGTELAADAAVVGIGAVPNTEWLEGSGLPVDNGVVCDRFCRVEGHENVFAVGDVARWWHPRRGEHRRIEHWTHACEQASVVAHNIARGDLRPHDPVEYVWSDQYDWRIQMAGRTDLGTAPELVGRPGEGPFAALYPDAYGAFAGAVTVNWPKAMLASRRLLVGGADVEAAVAAVRALSPQKVTTAG